MQIPATNSLHEMSFLMLWYLLFETNHCLSWVVCLLFISCFVFFWHDKSGVNPGVSNGRSTSCVQVVLSTWQHMLPWVMSWGCNQAEVQTSGISLCKEGPEGLREELFPRTLSYHLLAVQAKWADKLSSSLAWTWGWGRDHLLEGWWLTSLALFALWGSAAYQSPVSIPCWAPWTALSSGQAQGANCCRELTSQ